MLCATEPLVISGLNPAQSKYKVSSDTACEEGSGFGQNEEESAFQSIFHIPYSVTASEGKRWCKTCILMQREAMAREVDVKQVRKEGVQQANCNNSKNSLILAVSVCSFSVMA